MDRSIVYAGAAAQDVDLLFPQRGAMQALGMLAQMVLGDVSTSGPLINGLSIVPTTPGSMQVVLGAGAMFGLDAVDAAAYGSLAADTAHQIIQIAMNLDPVTLPPLVPPTGGGQSQCFLIEAQALQSDTGQVVLPFWNAANTAQPYLGMANNAGSLPTQRVRRVIAQVVAGPVASAGSPTVPSPTAGWVPLATIVLSAGQTTITSAGIVPYVPGAQLSFTLPQLSPGFARSTVLTSTAGNSGGNAGTFMVPVGVKTLKVTYTGGGGGGSACQASGANTAISGGSGGAGATQIAIISVTPGQSLSWLVGLGGASQSDGGATSFGSLPATAGGHGAPGFSGSGSSISSPGGAGGQAVGSGSSGGDGTDGQNGGTVSIGGVGGASYWGGGGRAGAGKGTAGAITLQGQNGRAWGSGGGGTNDLSNTNVNFPGGAGAPGIIVVEY